MDSFDGFDGAASGAIRAGGKLGNAMQFDGVDDYVLLPHGITPTGDMTIEAWVNGVAWDATEQNGSRIYEDWAETLFGVLSDGRVRFSRHNGVALQAFTTAATISAGSWHHVAGVYESATGTHRVYIDGVQAVSGINQFNTTQNSFLSPRIGRQIQDLANTEFNGKIDELAIYSIALTPAQIAARYNGGAGTRY